MGRMGDGLFREWADRRIFKNKGKNAGQAASSYDKATQKPVLHKSICTGETTAGFKDLKTGKYTDVMLIRNDADLKSFMNEYGISEKPETEY